MEEIGVLFSNLEMLSQYMNFLLKDLTEADGKGNLENRVGNRDQLVINCFFLNIFYFFYFVFIVLLSFLFILIS